MHDTRRDDVLIIGGGHNGLVCAAYLAAAGLKVRVLERRLGLLVVAREHHDRDPHAGQDGRDGDRAQQSGARFGHPSSMDGCSSGTAPSQPCRSTVMSDGGVMTRARRRGMRSV